MSRIKYRMSDDVAHVDNIEKRLKVRRVVYKDKKLSHIVCSWWSKDGEYMTDSFHSYELIPWSIAERGQESVDSFLKSIEYEKKLKLYSDEQEKYSNPDQTSDN